MNSPFKIRFEIETICQCERGNFLRVSTSPSERGGALVATLQMSTWTWGVFVVSKCQKLSNIRSMAHHLAESNIDDFLIYLQKHSRHGIVQVSLTEGFESFLFLKNRYEFSANYTSFLEAHNGLIQLLLPTNLLPPVANKHRPKIPRVRALHSRKYERIELIGNPDLSTSISTQKSQSDLEPRHNNKCTSAPHKSNKTPSKSEAESLHVKSCIDPRIKFNGCVQSDDPEMLALFQRLCKTKPTKRKLKKTEKLKTCKLGSVQIESLGIKSVLEHRARKFLKLKRLDSMYPKRSYI